MDLLHAVQQFAWDDRSGCFFAAVARAPAGQHFGGLGGEVGAAIWLHDGHMDAAPALARAALSIVGVGLGAALGREGAPKQAGAAAASLLAGRAELDVPQRRLLAVCGAGRGWRQQSMMCRSAARCCRCAGWRRRAAWAAVRPAGCSRRRSPSVPCSARCSATSRPACRRARRRCLAPPASRPHRPAGGAAAARGCRRRGDGAAAAAVLDLFHAAAALEQSAYHHGSSRCRAGGGVAAS